MILASSAHRSSQGNIGICYARRPVSYKVMPFGMKNSPATFQRLVNIVISGLVGCDAYIDDAIIHSDTFEEHLQNIRAFFDRLTDAKLTVNLAKSEFCYATLTFLGHVVGQGQVKPIRL